MKRFFLLLVVLNLGVFLWLYPQWSVLRRTSRVLEPEVGSLRLLSEVKEVGALRTKAGNDSTPRLAQATRQEPQLAQDLESAIATHAEQVPGQQQEQLPGPGQEEVVIEESAPPDQVPIPDSEQPGAPMAEAVLAEQRGPETADSGEIPLAQEPEQNVVQASAAGSEQGPLPELGLAQTAEPVVLQQPEEPVVLVECYRLGPFEQQAQAAKLVQRLMPLGLESAIQEEIVQKEAGHWVIHPPSATAELAQAKERELKAAGLADIWRIREGDMKGAISLGLFFEKKNAENMKRQIEAKGFRPEIRLRQVEQPVYWINLRARADVAPLEKIEVVLQGQRPALEVKPLPCPDIVSP